MPQESIEDQLRRDLSDWSDGDRNILGECLVLKDGPTGDLGGHIVKKLQEIKEKLPDYEQRREFGRTLSF